MHGFLKNILLSGLFTLLFHFSNAQNWEVNILKSVNPKPPFSKFWIGISSTAEPLSAGIPLSLFIVATFNKSKALKQNSIEMVEGLAITTIITGGLKITINRPRPYEKYNEIYPYEYEKGGSFPSGHVAAVFSSVTSLAIQFHKWYIVVPAYAWALGVSYSRLYLGQHYPTDILASAVIASGCSWLTHKINIALTKRKAH